MNLTAGSADVTRLTICGGGSTPDACEWDVRIAAVQDPGAAVGAGPAITVGLARCAAPLETCVGGVAVPLDGIELRRPKLEPAGAVGAEEHPDLPVREQHRRRLTVAVGVDGRLVGSREQRRVARSRRFRCAGGGAGANARRRPVATRTPADGRRCPERRRGRDSRRRSTPPVVRLPSGAGAASARDPPDSSVEHRPEQVDRVRHRRVADRERIRVPPCASPATSAGLPQVSPSSHEPTAAALSGPKPSAAAAVEASRSSWSRSSPPAVFVAKTSVLRGVDGDVDVRAMRDEERPYLRGCQARRIERRAELGRGELDAFQQPANGHRRRGGCPAGRRTARSGSRRAMPELPGAAVPSRTAAGTGRPGSSTQAQKTPPSNRAAAGSPCGAGGSSNKGWAERHWPAVQVFT